MTNINVITIIITGCLESKGVKEDVGSSSDLLVVGVVSLTRMASVAVAGAVGEGGSSVSSGGNDGSVLGSSPTSLKSFASSAIPLNIVKTSDVLSLNRL